MKKYLLLAFSAALCTSAWGSRALNRVTTHLQPDGSTIQVLLHGDEHYNYFTTPDWRPLLRQEDGSFVVSTWEAVHQQAQRRANSIDDYPSENTYPIFFPHVGQPKACVILMEFPDTPFTYSKEQIEVWLNGEQTQFSSSMSSTGSVAGYYEHSSQGQFRPQFDVYGPYQTDSVSSWYGYAQGGSTSAFRLVSNALASADPDVDFTQYDNYGDDGMVDLVYVIFSGQGANQSHNLDQPWSLSGTLPNLGTYDGVRACRYGLSNEVVVGSNATYQTGIGVFCHELAHTLGLPDLYDTTNALPNWDNNGPEPWDLMDDGENVINGMWPMPLTAWERDVFSWIELEELTTPQDVTLYPLNDPEGRGKAYKVLNPANSCEYYTFENIPDSDWYSWLKRYNVPGGMIATHINFNRPAFVANRVNTKGGIPNLTILPADGYLLSSASIGEEREIDGETVLVDRAFYRAHLGGDPYPGVNEVHALEAYHNYAGDEDMVASLPITDIEKHEDGSVSFKFMGGSGESITSVKDDNEDASIYRIDGQYAGWDLQNLSPGLYIVNGRVKAIR